MAGRPGPSCIAAGWRTSSSSRRCITSCWRITSRRSKLAAARRDRLTAQIEAMLPDWTLAPVVAALQTMRGMALVNAATLIAELGDLTRFANPRQLMAYLGLVPSEHSSGASVKRGSITKAGNGAARRLLIEAAWSYRFPDSAQPRVAAAPGEPAEADPRHRLEGASPAVHALSQARPHRQAGQCRHHRDRPRAVGLRVGHRSAGDGDSRLLIGDNA